MNRRKNSFEFCVNIAKFCWEVVARIRFWSTLSKCGTHSAQSIPKISYMILNTLPYDIFVISASSLNFTLGSFNIISSIFSAFSGIRSLLGVQIVQHHLCLFGPNVSQKTTFESSSSTVRSPYNTYLAWLWSRLSLSCLNNSV